MKIRDLLSTTYGPNNKPRKSRLADLAPGLLERQAAKAEAEYQEILAAEQARSYRGLREAAVDANNAALVDNDQPCISTYEAARVAKSAAKAYPTDRGIKFTAGVLQDRWSKDKTGYLTVGEVFSLRETVKDMFPRSAGVKVLDENVAGAGFNAIANRSYLDRIASDITDQASYEQAITAYRLDTDAPAHVQARAYIRASVESQLSDAVYSGETGLAMEAAISRAMDRYAQLDEEDGFPAGDPAIGPASEEPDEGLDEDFEEEDEDFGPDIDGEVDLAEMGEDDQGDDEVVTIESPVSGEELTLELSVKEDEGPAALESPDLDDGAMEDDVADTADFPDFSEHDKAAQTMSVIPDEEAGSPVGAEPAGPAAGPMPTEAPALDAPMPAGPALDEGEPVKETITTIVDPTSGQQLQVTLAPIEEELPEDVQPIEDVEPATPGISEGGVEDEPMMTSASVRQWLGENGLRLVARKVAKAKAAKVNKNLKLSKDDVIAICAAMNVTAQLIEDTVLGGDGIAIGRYLLQVGSGDQVELHRMARENDDSNTKVVRTAAFNEFDAIIGDFMAYSASQYPELKPATAVEQKVAAAPTPRGYVLLAEVPEGGQLVARRMMASVWKVVGDNDGDGEFLDDGRLAIVIRHASQGAVNRIQRIFTDVYGVQRFEANAIPGLAEKSAQLKPLPPVAPGVNTAPQSPYQGQAPAGPSTAGQPMQPGAMPQQTSSVGSGAQQAMIQQGLNPLDPNKAGMNGLTAEEDGMCPECEEKKCSCVAKAASMVRRLAQVWNRRVAQLAPAPEGDAVAPAAPAPMGDPGAPGLGDSAIPEMGDDPMADPMAGGMSAGGMTGDASQIPLDPANGQLEPQDEGAVTAAMTHFRNQGLMPLEAIKNFVSHYGDMLDKYGDEANPQRGLAEAAVIRIMGEAYQKPAIMPTSHKRRSSRQVQAEVSWPKPKAPSGGKAKAPKFPAQGTTIPTPAINKRPGKPSGKPPSTNMGPDTSGNAMQGPVISTTMPKLKGKLPSTSITKGTDGNGRSSIMGGSGGGKIKFPSRSASQQSEDIFVLSTDRSFDVMLGRKRVAAFNSFTSALADAERRSIGTDARVFVESEDGFEQV